MSYFNRYQRGEFQPVWNELVDAGVAVWNKPLFNDARDVALATMERVRKNLERLQSRLEGIGYEFMHPEPVALANRNAVDKLTAFENAYGRLAISASVWYQTFQCVDFEQSTDQYEGVSGPNELHGLGLEPAMTVRSIQHGIKTWNERRRLGKTVQQNILLVGPTLSNCDTAHFELDAHHMDDLNFADDGCDDARFVEHIRFAINRCGGLDWRDLPEHNRLIQYLSDDLEPF
ncbi:MAG: hypothetical protein ACR2NP_10295 [Pirellulaceae bacterium]